MFGLTGTNSIPVAVNRRFAARDLKSTHQVQGNHYPNPSISFDTRSRQQKDIQENEDHFHRSSNKGFVDRDTFFDAVEIKPEDIKQVQYDRGRTHQPRQSNDYNPSKLEGGEKKRKRGNRWSDEKDNNAVAGLVGLPTAIYSQMTSEQLDAYSTHLRIQEITQKLKIGDLNSLQRIRWVNPFSFVEITDNYLARLLLHQFTTNKVAVPTPARPGTARSLRQSVTT